MARLRRGPCGAGEKSLAWDTKNPFFGKVYRNTADHITGITNTTRADVMKVISNGYDQGKSIPEVAADIRDTIKGSSLGRSMMIARTEMASFQNGASLSAAQVVGQAVGVDYQKQWLTAPGAEHPRHEDYEGLDGQTVALGDTFDVGGDQLQYPGDPDGDPGEVINCRCSLVYIDQAGSETEPVDADQLEGSALLDMAARARARSSLAQKGVLTTDLFLADLTRAMTEPLRDVLIVVASAAALQSTGMEKTVDEFADNSASCANCDHAMSAHAGDDNMGACTMEDCACEGYETASAETEEAAVSADLNLVPAVGPAVIVYNGVQYAPVTAETTSNGTATFQNGWVNVQEAKEETALDDDIAATIPTEHQPASEVPEGDGVEAQIPEAEQRTNAAHVPWHAIFAPEGKATDDGRIFAPDSIGWRTLPLTLMAMTETPGEGGHAGAELCGRIDSIYRVDTTKPTMIEADGVFNDDEYGQQIAQLVEEGFLTGNSVDLAVSDYALVLRADVVDEDGYWKEGVDIEDVPAVDIFDIFFGAVDPADVIYVIKDAVIGMSTVCPFPAFAEATISLQADGSQTSFAIVQGQWGPLTHVFTMDAFRVKYSDGQLTASAAGMVPVTPPEEWFSNPELEGLTPLTVTDEGRVYGHAWSWGECHIGIQDSCTIAPHSKTGYAYFLLKEVETADGNRAECGTITLDTNHAGRGLGWREASAHYDHTGTAIADVTFGEDEHGGWFAGSLRPDATTDAVRKFRRGSVSGDWRRIHNNLELVGLLTVNVPGFPIPRPKALVSSGEEGMEVLTLIAAGVARKDDVVVEVTEADRSVLAAIVSGEMQELRSIAASVSSEPAA